MVLCFLVCSLRVCPFTEEVSVSLCQFSFCYTECIIEKISKNIQQLNSVVYFCFLCYAFGIYLQLLVASPPHPLDPAGALPSPRSSFVPLSKFLATPLGDLIKPATLMQTFTDLAESRLFVCSWDISLLCKM